MHRNVSFPTTWCLAKSSWLLQHHLSRGKEVWDRKQAKQTLPILCMLNSSLREIMNTVVKG